MWEQSAAHLSDVQATRSDRREQAGAWDRVRLNLTEVSIVLLLTWQGLQQGLQPGLHAPRNCHGTGSTQHAYNHAYTTCYSLHDRAQNNPHFYKTLLSREFFVQWT